MQNTKGRWGFLTAIAAMFSSMGASKIENPYVKDNVFNIPPQGKRGKFRKSARTKTVAFINRLKARRAAAKAARKARRITRQFAH